MLDSPTLPLLFRDALESLGMKSIDEWWLGLEAEEHEGMLALWSSCQAPSASSIPAHGQRMTARVEAYFEGDLEGQPVFWHNDFYEFLVNHEEYVYREIPFHVCFRQPEALAALKAGEIRPDFRCPVSHVDCPMAQSPAVADGRTMKFTLRFVPVAQPNLSHGPIT